MSSPFPGMDPYLEHPILWHDLQQYFITHLADTLTEVLPRRYLVNIQDRVYRTEAEIDISDHLSPSPLCITPSNNHFTHPNEPESAVTPPWNIPSTHEELREYYVEIFATTGRDEPLTVIEFLSFPNKTIGNKGHELYRTRQRKALADDSHILEIDLLRTGVHTVLAPQERILRRGKSHYLVSLSRSGGREFCEVWGFTLRDRLPKVAVPVAGSDPDLVLDLQTLLARCYEAGGFGRRIDYTDDPFLPLSRNLAEWAVPWLRQHGIHI
ncbi:MAG: DUF4058 family protein [Gemmataceae bacterium]